MALSHISIPALRRLFAVGLAVIITLGAVAIAIPNSASAGPGGDCAPWVTNACGWNPDPVEFHFPAPPLDPIGDIVESAWSWLWGNTAGKLLKDVIGGYVDRFNRDSARGTLTTGCEQGC